MEQIKHQLINSLREPSFRGNILKGIPSNIDSEAVGL